MKRALLATLLLSLAANVVFLTRASRSTPLSTASAVYPAFSDVASAKAEAQTTAPAFSATDWSALRDASPRARTFLRELGLTDADIRAIVRAEVDARYADRERALHKNPAYWEHAFTPQFLSSRETVTDPTAARDLALQKENELRQLLGDIYEPVHPQLRQYTSYLPFEKAWRLKLINDDYHLLRADSQGRGTSLRLPTSPEQTHYLREQQQADIEALLTPEELYVHDIHTSNTANFLRNLAGFNATKQEFVALYELRKSLEPRRSAAFDDPAQRAAFEELIEQQTNTLLGEKRYADYQRAQDLDFRANYGLAADLGLPTETALAGYEHLKSLKARSAAFAAQNSPSREQLDTFHAQLLQESEATLSKLYGEQGLAAARNRFLLRLSRQVR